jgi:preprotein translocase subunit SecF
MSKYTKTVGKIKLWAIVAAAVFAIGVIILAIFGFNTAQTASSAKTLTVKLDSYVSVQEERLEKVKDICETEISAKGLKAKYDEEGEYTDGKKEIVYVFSENVEAKTLAETADAVQAALDKAVAEENSGIYTATLYVTSNSETVKSVVPTNYIWRGILAMVVVLAVEFIYVAVRYKLNMGVATTVSSLVSALLTFALVGIVRIPVTTSLAYVGAFSLLYTALLNLAIFNRLRDNLKSDEFKAQYPETNDAIAASVPVKGLLTFVIASAVALVLVGAIAVTSVRWFALAALLSLLVSTYSALLFMPALYLPLKKAADKKAAKRARYDYKLGDKKDKAEKTEEKTEEKAE